MKKIMLVIALISTIFLAIGCNSGNQPQEPNKVIKIFMEGEASAAMNQIKVFTQNVEIRQGDRIYLNGTFMIPTLSAVLYVDDVAQTTQLDLSADFSGVGENDCFNISNVQPYHTGYGTQGDVYWTNPGKARFVATYEGESVEATIFAFDGITRINLGGNAGIRIINLTERENVFNNPSQCFIYNDAFEGPRLPGKSYIAAFTTTLTWQNDLYNIRAVDNDLLNSGIIDRPAPTSKCRIYVCENPAGGGGYVKLAVVPGFPFFAWDWSEDGNFRE